MKTTAALAIASVMSLSACGAPEPSAQASSPLTVTAQATGFTLVENESFATRPLSGSNIDEHCAIPAATMTALGLTAPRQIRVQLDSGRYAVCTLVANQTSPNANQIVMTRAAIADKNLAANASVTLSTTVVNNGAYTGHATWAAWRSAVSAAGDFAERSDLRTGNLANGRSCVAIAPHGGAIDADGTDLQAEAVGLRLTANGGGCSVWAAAGFDAEGGGDAHDVWHTTSTEISRASFPQLDAVMGSRTNGRFDRAVAFHAMSSTTAGCSAGGASCQRVFVGGGASATARDAMITAIQSALAGVTGGSNVTVSAFPAGTTVGGTASSNIVNRMAVSGAGLHLEQTAYVITNFGTVIANAVADQLAAN